MNTDHRASRDARISTLINNVCAKFQTTTPEEVVVPTRHYIARGAAAQLFNERGPVILSGPSETGKTLGCLHYLDSLAWKYPGFQGAIVRQTYKSMIGTVLQTFQNKVLTQGDGVEVMGGSKPDWYDYPNGSRIWVGGMDNPDKVLSSERDAVYFNQAEEALLSGWETLTTRTTGRAGNMPWGQTFGDCNPSIPQHWIKVKASEGKLKLLESTHKDNPILWDAERGEWTPQGKRTIGVLSTLSGARHSRLYLGLWAAAEGVVYDCFVRANHVKSYSPSYMEMILEFLRDKSRYSVAGVDWGYRDPGVISVWAVDHDKRMRRVAQIYRTGEVIGWWIARAKELRDEFNIRAFACDPSRPDNIQQFKTAGLPAVPAFNDISLGVQNMYRRLETMVPADSFQDAVRTARSNGQNGNGLGAVEPMMVYCEDALRFRDETLAEAHKPTCSEEEIESYVWPVGQNGKPQKEVPIDDNNHGMDADRYAAAYVDRLRKKGQGGGGTWVTV